MTVGEKPNRKLDQGSDGKLVVLKFDGTLSQGFRVLLEIGASGCVGFFSSARFAPKRKTQSSRDYSSAAANARPAVASAALASMGFDRALRQNRSRLERLSILVAKTFLSVV